MQGRAAQVSARADAAKHRPRGQCGQVDPVAVGTDRAQPGEGRGLEFRPKPVVFGLGAMQIERHPLPGRDRDVLHAQPAQLVAAKGPPESDQDERPIAGRPQEAHAVGVGGRLGDRRDQGGVDLRQFGDRQGEGAALAGGMERTDPFQDLADQRCLGRVGKPLVAMPLRERRQAQFQRVQRQGWRVGRQIAGHGIGGSRQEPAPGLLEMAYGRGVTAAGVIAGRSGEVVRELGHGDRWGPAGVARVGGCCTGTGPVFWNVSAWTG